MRALGVDFGERRIGLALSDPDGRLALPLAVVERSSDAQAVAAIVAIAREHEVELLVVGEPRRIGGAPESEAFRRAHAFGEKLAAAAGLPLTWIDEAFTSAAAAARLREAGLDARRARGKLDAVAAQILLQEALDRRARPDDGSGA
jgi:putative Holliday junction resolvase